jgi:HNH endonuclease/NUMOD4 motif
MFLPVPGYEGKYSVSTQGCVISHNYNKTGRVAILKGLTTKQGYKQVKFAPSPGKRKYFLVHRLVMLTFVGPPPADKPHVNHKSGIKSNNALTNLEYCTREANMRHAYDTGLLIPRHGAAHRNSKLTLALIEKARAKYMAGASQIEIAQEFGVNPSQISRVLGGKRWIRAMKAT